MIYLCFREILLSYRVGVAEGDEFRKMAKKKTFMPFKVKAFIPLICIVFLPWWISFLLKKGFESWVTNWWNTFKYEMILNDIQEKSILKTFIELEELFFLDEMLKEYPETSLQELRIGIYRETIQLIKAYNENRIQTILHFSTNIIYFIILSVYSILGNEELFILNSWVQEFLYNLSDTLKALSILLLADFFFGYHSTQGWELMIDLVYKDFGLAQNDQIRSILVSICPAILGVIFKFWIFFYLNRISPSLVVIYSEIKN